jgi:hypothetical protein
MGPGYEIQSFSKVGILGRRWYFRVVDTGNWEKVMTSEAYNTQRARNETMRSISMSTSWPVIPRRNGQ